MNAPASFAPPSEHYRRLFGTTPPAQAIVPVSSPGSSIADGNLGPPPPHFRDPNEGSAGHFLFELLAMEGHPSAASLASLAALRNRHLAKGYHPSRDAEHGPQWFWHGAHEFYWRAIDAGPDRITRRKRLIASAAMLVALIDAEDFQAQQQENAGAADER